MRVCTRMRQLPMFTCSRMVLCIGYLKQRDRDLLVQGQMVHYKRNEKKIEGFNIEEQGSLCRNLTDLVHAHVRLWARRLQWIIVLKIILSVHKTPEQLQLSGLESVATACLGGNLNSERTVPLRTHNSMNLQRS